MFESIDSLDSKPIATVCSKKKERMVHIGLQMCLVVWLQVCFTDVDVFGSGSALVCMHLFGLLRIETSSSTESALWDASLCVCFSVLVYFMFGKLPMFTAAAL
ncbi:hypothetical protein Tco_1449732 [Tanacetum coccineum]